MAVRRRPEGDVHATLAGANVGARRAFYEEALVQRLTHKVKERDRGRPPCRLAVTQGTEGSLWSQGERGVKFSTSAHASTLRHAPP